MGSPRKSLWLLPPAVLLETAAVTGWLVPDSIPGGPGAPLACHLAAVGVFGLYVLASFRADGFAQGMAAALLAVLLAVFVPAAGILGALWLIATLVRGRGEPAPTAPFVIGVPPADSAIPSTELTDSEIGEPLVHAMRRLDAAGLQRLTLGLKYRRPGCAFPILRRLRRARETTVQIYAQGVLSDTLANLDSHLHALSQKTAADPKDTDSRLAIAEIQLFMIEENLDPFGASDIHIRKALDSLEESARVEPPQSPSPRRLYLEARCHLALRDLETCQSVLQSLSSIPGAGHLASRISLRATHAKRAWNALAERVRQRRFALDYAFSEPCRFWREVLPASDA